MTLRLGIAAPLPPAPTGPADYVAGILPAIAGRAQVTCFTADPEGVDPAIRERYPVVHLDRRENGAADILVYHVANNVHHTEINEAAMNGPPGILMVHDGSLHHERESKTLGEGDAERYREILEAAHGARGASLARLREAGTKGELELFLFDALGPLLTRHLGAVVHSRYTAEIVRLRAPAVPVTVIPHYAPPTPDPRPREALGLPADRFVVGHFGFLTGPKRAGLIVRAVARAVTSGEDVHLVFAGEDQTEGVLESEIDRLGLTDRVTKTGFLETKQRLLEYISSVDLVVSLRSPHAGETSGSATAALSAGKPLIVQDVGSWAELPPDVALRIGTDDEEETLAGAIITLASDPALRAKYSEAARAYARTELDVDRCAARLVSVAREVAAGNGHRSEEVAKRDRIHWLLQGTDRIKRAIYGSGSITSLAVASESFERYRSTLEAIPPARPGQRLLDIGSLAEFLRMLESFWGYEVRGCSFVPRPQAIRMPADDMSPETTIRIDPVDVEVEPLPYPTDSFDVVTCLEVIEHLGRDPMHMLWEANRVLRPGGLFILTTPNIVSARSVRAVLTGYHPQLWSEFLTNARADRHNREYTPREIRVLLENAGFSSDGVQTRNTWGEDDPEILDLLRSVDLYGGVPVEDRGDTILAVARKAMLPAERFPQEFYY